MAARNGSVFKRGNHWGTFAAPGDLPNVLNSTTANDLLEVGDEAFVDASGTNYVCLVATKGGAQWTPVGAGSSDGADPITLFVNQATGADTNPGTSASAPLATLTAALDRVPRVLDRTYNILFTDTVNVTYSGEALGRTFDTVGGNLNIRGENFETLASGTATAADATGGTITDAALGAAVDDFVGRTLVVTPAAGGGLVFYRSIRDNTATVITPCQPVETLGTLSPVAVPIDVGDAFSIGSPRCTIDLAPLTDLEMGGAVRATADQFICRLINVTLTAGSSVQVLRGGWDFRGVEISAVFRNLRRAGMDTSFGGFQNNEVGPQNDGFADVTDGGQWLGWGAHVIAVAGSLQQETKPFIGWQSGGAATVSEAQQSFWLPGSRLTGTFSVGQGGAATLGQGSDAQTLIRNLGGALLDRCFQVFGFGSVGRIFNTLCDTGVGGDDPFVIANGGACDLGGDVIITTVGGPGIEVTGASRLYHFTGAAPSVDITSGGIGVACTDGGLIVLETAFLSVVATGDGFSAQRVGRIVLVPPTTLTAGGDDYQADAVTAAALPGVGTPILGANGSIITRT